MVKILAVYDKWGSIGLIIQMPQKGYFGDENGICAFVQSSGPAYVTNTEFEAFRCFHRSQLIYILLPVVSFLPGTFGLHIAWIALTAGVLGAMAASIIVYFTIYGRKRYDGDEQLYAHYRPSLFAVIGQAMIGAIVFMLLEALFSLNVPWA